MQTLSRIALVAAAVLLPAIASAAVLTTSPQMFDSSRRLSCLAANVTSKSLEVKFEVVDFTGAATNVGTVTLPAGQSRFTTNSPPYCAGNKPCYCRFSFTGGAKSLRGAACVTDAASPLSIFNCLTLIEAR